MSDAPETLQPVERRITQEQLVRYADASGDHNPLHLDEEFARGTPYGRTIAHGMLVLALVSEECLAKTLAYALQRRLRALRHRSRTGWHACPHPRVFHQNGP